MVELEPVLKKFQNADTKWHNTYSTVALKSNCKAAAKAGVLTAEEAQSLRESISVAK